MKYIPANKRQCEQHGLGMVEVMVTLFILSIGLLGVAYLQFVGSYTNSEALSRSQSVLVAQQFSERLRVSAVFSPIGNGLVVDNDYFDPDLYDFSELTCAGGSLPHECYCLARPASIPDCSGNSCTATEIAKLDAYEVSCSAVLANPDIEINLSCEDNDLVDAQACSVGSKHIITLTWPVEDWRGISRTLNALCNIDKTTPHDCVSLEVTL